MAHDNPRTDNPNRPALLALPPGAPPPLTRAAASLIVLRDAPRGLEVLMLKRADRPGDQNGGAAVFPGGLLDASDRGHYERCQGMDDATASLRMGLAQDGLNPVWASAPAVNARTIHHANRCFIIANA